MGNDQRYAVLANLDFDHRSQEERTLALQRPTLPEGKFESAYIKRRLGSGDNPFTVDINYITGDYLFRRMGSLGQLAPTFSPGFQNRMTHTQHAAQIAERVCQRMHLCTQSSTLAQAIAFAHDLGHAPFSHEGETVFKEKLSQFGGIWDHDAFGFRILTEFAHGGLTYYGMPLTNATLEGALKRYWRFRDDRKSEAHFNRPTSSLPDSAKTIEQTHHSLHLEGWSPVEGQIASISDWIAGTVSDTRDMLLLELHQSSPKEFMAYCDKFLGNFPAASNVWNHIQSDVRKLEQNNPSEGLSKEPYYARMQSIINLFSTELENFLVDDVLEATLVEYQRSVGKIKHAEDVRTLDAPMIQFSRSTYKQIRQYNTYFAKEVFPRLLRENVDTVTLMRRFFDIVQNHFEKPVPPNGMPIDENWLKIYEHIKDDKSLDDKQRSLKLTTLVAEYITCNFNDSDVLYFIRTLDPQFHAAHVASKKPGLYPPYAHPDTPVTYQKRVAIQKQVSSAAPERH